MDEILKVLVGTSPILVGVIFLVRELTPTIKEIAISWHADREKAAMQREAILFDLNDITRRVKLLEAEQIGEVSPTLPGRPEGVKISV